MKPLAPAQLVLDLPVRTAMGREDFLVAPCNRDAVAWVDRWPDWPAPCLVLFGPPGSGKTHLAHVWQQRASAVWGADRNGYDLLDCLGGGGSVCLDINGVVEDEELLFHLYNRARDNRGTLLLTGRAPASGWSLRLSDLDSRLRSAPQAGLLPPDDALLAAVLVKLFADRQLEVEPNVLNYLVSRMERSFAAAGALVARLDREALAAQRSITVPLARRVLDLPPDD